MDCRERAALALFACRVTTVIIASVCATRYAIANVDEKRTRTLLTHLVNCLQGRGMSPTYPKEEMKMIMTLHTGITGYRLARGEVQPVLDSLTARLGFDIRNVVLRDVAHVDGAPNLVVAADVVAGDRANDYPMVIAHSGPLSDAGDICDALAHIEAGRTSEPMCPKALKRIDDFKRLASVTSLKPALNMVWAIKVPEQRIYWLIAAVRAPNPNVMAFTLDVSTPR